MKKYTLIALALVAAFTCSCRKNSIVPLVPGAQVQFTASMQTFDTKATDTALENGDAIGIFAGTPIGATNVQATVSGTTVTPATTISWIEGQTAATDFIAYYPYDATLSSTSTSFSVKTDQSTYAAYAASDLLAAKANVAPENTVAFNLTHQLSKLILKVSCEDTADGVKSVTIGDMAIDVTADLSAQTVRVGTNKAPIIAGKAVAANGNVGYVAILVPQNAQPTVTVVTNNGKTQNFKLESPKDFAKGTAYTATLVVPKEVVPAPGGPVAFTVNVTDWNDGGTLNFVDPDNVTAPARLYIENKSGWETLYLYAYTDELSLAFGDWPGAALAPTTIEGVTYYYIDIPASAVGQSYHLICNNGGYGEGNQTGDSAPVYFGEEDIFLTTTATEINIPGVELSGVWSVIGTINGSNWDQDFDMTETSDGIWEIDITYAEGDLFKLRRDGVEGNWATQAAMPGTAVEDAIPVPTGEDGYGLWRENNKDIMLSATGKIHLKFKEEGTVLYVTPAE